MLRSTLFKSAVSEFLNARNFLLAHRENYDKAYAEFKWPQLTQFNWAADYFDPMAKGNHKPALWLVGEQGEQKYSFDEMSRRSNQVANYLVKQGVQPFDRVMLMLPNTPELWESMLAAIKIPAVIVPASTMLPKEDLAYRVKKASISYVIAPTSEANKFDDIAVKNKIAVGESRPGWSSYRDSIYCDDAFSPLLTTQATDPLFNYFTSGTTAAPKCVIHTHASYPVGHLSTMYWLGLQSDDYHLNIASPGWGKHAWSSFFAPWNAGACVFSYAYRRFNVKSFLQILGRYPITSLCAPPAVWQQLSEENLENYPVHLEKATSAGDVLDPARIKQVKDSWGVVIRGGYGATETTATMGHCPGQTVIPGTLGSPLPGYRLGMTGEGELVIKLIPRPVGFMQGYDDPEKTEQVVHDDLFHSGDVIVPLPQDPKAFRFAGRKDDSFKSSGYLINPVELESKLLEHPSVLEAAVVPSLHSEKGAVPKAFVVLKKGENGGQALAEALFHFIENKIPASHGIRIIQFCDQLPKTISEKTIRRELRKEEAAGKYTASPFLFKKEKMVDTSRANNPVEQNGNFTNFRR